MKLTHTLAMATVLFAAVSAGEALAGKRSSTVTGPNGNTWYSTGERVCANGVCTYSGQTTGPRGTWNRNSSARLNGDGTISTQGQVTTPTGRIFKRNGTISR